jgi:hypothetical protein
MLPGGEVKSALPGPSYRRLGSSQLLAFGSNSAIEKLMNYRRLCARNEIRVLWNQIGFEVRISITVPIFPVSTHFVGLPAQFHTASSFPCRALKARSDYG